MLQINDFWSNLSAEVLNFSGMSADMFAALLYAVVSIGNLHQGPNLFAVLAPFLMKWASLYINKKNCQLFFILSLSPEARYKFEVSQGRAFDLSAFKLWLCQSICHASSQVQLPYQRVYYHPSGSSQATHTSDCKKSMRCDSFALAGLLRAHHALNAWANANINSAESQLHQGVSCGILSLVGLCVRCQGWTRWTFNCHGRVETWINPLGP